MYKGYGPFGPWHICRRDRRGRDRMVVGFTTTYSNSVLSPL